MSARRLADVRLRPLLAGCGADVVVGGHTHAATDRVVDGIRALNPGSAGLPHTRGAASWLLLEDDGAVVTDLRRRRHPNAEFVASTLTGQRQQARAPSAT